MNQVKLLSLDQRCSRLIRQIFPGVFMSFAESLNQNLRGSIPLSFMSLTFFAVYLAGTTQLESPNFPRWYDLYRGNSTESFGDYINNNLLIGSPDPFFWFLVPTFGVISIGM